MELDEEDSHLCLRCNQTIIGLQNYVNHRQSSCSTSQSVAKPSSKPFETNFDFINPHASKKMENYAGFHFGDERDEEIGRSGKAQGAQFKPYDHDFFSSLELQYMSKQEMPSAQHSKSFGHRILTRKATAEIMAQNGDEWIDETAATKKDDSAYKFFQPNESDSDEDSEESELEVPRNYTRGKWKPGSQPPINFTGGKWKPGKVPSWDENESSNDVNLEKSSEIEDSIPPPEHTKGKWFPGTKITKLEYDERDNFWCSFCSRNLATRPIYERHLKSNLHRKRMKEQNELEEAAESLPLSSLNELSSQLKGERVATSTPIPEHSDDEKQSKARKRFRSRSKVTCEVCDMKLPVHLLGNHLISHFHYRKMLQSPRKSFDIVLDNFHKIIVQSPFQCRPCKFYFNTQDEFMRHWNSTTHSKGVEKAGEGKFFCSLCKFDNKSHEAMTLHLNSSGHQESVSLINRSKPVIIYRLVTIECKKCWREFRYNLQLMKHLETCESPQFSSDGASKCDICQRVFQSALSLQKHKRNVHKSFVFFCTECQKNFPSAKAAKVHRRSAEHKALASRKKMRRNSNLKPTQRKRCSVCKETLLDGLELRNHILQSHPEQQFSCGRCGMKFPLAQEVSRHVRDKLCKFYSTERAFEPPATSTVTSNISAGATSHVNQENVESAPELMPDAIESNFTDILSPSSFVITPENEHEFGLIIEQMEQEIEVSFTCKHCDFSTGSHAEFLYHETLHTLSAHHKSKDKIECQICRKSFVSQSLREHMRQHTNERIFECPIDGCPMSFTRKANMKSHVANIHNKPNKAEHVCRICSKKFVNKYTLEQHKFVHRTRVETKTFPCKLPDCLYIGRSSTEMRSHLLTHSDERLFICDQLSCDYRGQTMEQLRSHSRMHQDLEFKFSCERCDYKTKFSGHLKRHLRVHEAEAGKIYKCPYCDYACNISENLRKHVLVSNKHPGRFMYECVYCEDEATRFKHNAMKEYQKHLKTAHSIMTNPS